MSNTLALLKSANYCCVKAFRWEEGMHQHIGHNVQAANDAAFSGRMVQLTITQENVIVFKAAVTTRPEGCLLHIVEWAVPDPPTQTHVPFPKPLERS